LGDKRSKGGLIFGDQYLLMVGDGRSKGGLVFGGRYLLLVCSSQMVMMFREFILNDDLF